MIQVEMVLPEHANIMAAVEAGDVGKVEARLIAHLEQLRLECEQG